MYLRVAFSNHKFESLCDGTSYAPVENYGLFGARVFTNCSFGTASMEMEVARCAEMHVNFYRTAGVTYSNKEIFNQCLF